MKQTNDVESTDRTALLEAAATAEQELIDAEQEAERALERAEARLDKTKKEFAQLERQLKERTKKVEEARAMLTAVQKRRADGPG